jgi:N utilization substance protein A
VNELGGEKIDVIEWDPDPAVFIAKALSPARVLSVHLDDDPANGRTATVVVPDDQLSLAIGREGQNARLAAKLTGWRIDIKSVTEATREALAQAADEHVQAELGNLVKLLPTAAVVLEHQRETHTSFSTEQLLLLKQVIDGVHKHFAAKRRAERLAQLDREASRRTAIAAEEAERRAERAKAIAQVPNAAYDIALEEIGLSTRVFNHLTKAKIENLGQIMERLVDGDEGLLALDGIGPKALAEVKSRIEAVAPAAPEEPPIEEPAETELEAALEPEPEPEPLPEEEPAVPEEVTEEVPIAAEVPVEAEVVAEVELEEIAEPEAEPEEVVEPEVVPEEVTEAEREKALAAIPADAYDIPLAVLALSGPVLSNLKKAKIENLGVIMELLAGGDRGLLALDGMDPKAVAEIKSQVEIMVSVPSAPSKAEAEAEEDAARVLIPRYEYVADDELERKAKPRRQRRQKQRRPVYEEDPDEVASGRKRSKQTYDEWDDFDE